MICIYLSVGDICIYSSVNDPIYLSVRRIRSDMRVLGVGDGVELRRKCLEVTVLCEIGLRCGEGSLPPGLEEDLGRTERVLLLLELLLIAGPSCIVA
jgi:hypothetical protein